MAPKIHFPRSISNYNRALASDNMTAILTVRAACGTRSTDRAMVSISTNPADVDCAKCRQHLPAQQEGPTVKEQMQAAYAAGDLEEVVRLSKLI